jgi:hypothetical protein
MPLGGGYHGGRIHGGAAARYYGSGYGHRHYVHRGYGGWYGWSYPDYGYYDEGQPSDGQAWYYPSDPSVMQGDNSAWQTVPRTGTVSQSGGVTILRGSVRGY